MKLKYQILFAALSAGGLGECEAALAQEVLNSSAVGIDKTIVRVAPAEDRWISLSDGTHVYQGLNISYLLVQKLFDSGRFTVFFEDPPTSARALNMKAENSARESQEQIPAQWVRWMNSPESRNSSLSIYEYKDVRDLRITPVVETLTYTSGDRSNRIFYGFSPDHLNPFNQGRAGSLDNEYVASKQQRINCTKPDFFGGTFNPPGWGPFQSNFGANADEGADIEIMGYGVGFRQKHFSINSQIRFFVDDLKTGARQELVFKTKARGQDLFFAGAYQGISLSFEIQIRDTLLKALETMLPQVVDQLIQEGLDKAPAQVPAGSLSVAEAAPEKVYENQFDIQTDPQTRAGQIKSSLTACFGDNSSFGIDQTLDSLMYLYGLYRYESIFDQSLHSDMKPVPAPEPAGVLRVAIIDSGVDYNMDGIGSHVIGTGQGGVAGFDFLSWDNRPSDDNGHGTAALLLLLKLVHVPFVVVPIKVIGPYGETHSSAVYDGFQYAIDSKVAAVVAPWASDPTTLTAYKMGSQLAAQNNIKVFVAPGTLSSETNIDVPAGLSTRFQSIGLGGTQVQLDSSGAAAIRDLAAWMNSQSWRSL